MSTLRESTPDGGRVGGPALSVRDLQKKRNGGKPIVMSTAYDALFARMLDEADVDVLLVGDSLGMVVQGREDTVGVTLEDVIYHCRCVARGRKRAHLVADMPFMSYQVSEAQALQNAARLVQEGHAQSVKLEGGREMAPTVSRLVNAGIAVMGHVGLHPQKVHQLGGFRVQGKTEESARAVVQDAVALEQAGAYALVIEAVPQDVAQAVHRAVQIPVIGIGAGPHCDGQVLVCYDLLGLNPSRAPKFVRAFGELFTSGVNAARQYAQAVRTRAFPEAVHCYGKGEGKDASAQDAATKGANVVTLEPPTIHSRHRDVPSEGEVKRRDQVFG